MFQLIYMPLQYSYSIPSVPFHSFFILFNLILLQYILSFSIQIYRIKNVGVNKSDPTLKLKVLGSVCVPCGEGSFKTDSKAGPCTPCPIDTYQDMRGSKVGRVASVVVFFVVVFVVVLCWCSCGVSCGGFFGGKVVGVVGL